MQNTKKPTLNYINIYRGLAILLIVMGHTLQIGAVDSLIRKISFEIFSNGTAVFVFISGFLFQYLSHKFEYKNFLIKKFENVISPYFFVSILGITLAILLPFFYSNPFDGLNPILQIGAMLTTGRVQNVPLWFIPMIAIFFLLSATFIKLNKKNILYKILPLMLVYTIFLPRGDIEPQWLEGMSYLNKYLAYVKYVLNGFLHFCSMYVLGMYFSDNLDKIDNLYKKRHILWFLMLSISALDIALSYFYNYCNGTVSKILFTILLLIYLKKYDEKIIENVKLNKVLNFLANYSFGIFFIHWYFYIPIYKNFNTPFVEVNILNIFLTLMTFLWVLGASILTLFILKKVCNKLNIKNTRKFFGL